MNNQYGIYQTLEFHCWGGGMKYKEDYLDMMARYSPKLTPVSEKMYSALMVVFDADYEDAMRCIGEEELSLPDDFLDPCPS